MFMILFTLFVAFGEDRGQTPLGPPPEASSFSARHALVIGVSNYHHPGWADLEGVCSDLHVVSRALSRRGFQVHSHFDPNLNEMRAAFHDFVAEYGQQEDVALLIYFAGHGYSPRVNGKYEQGFLVPSDAAGTLDSSFDTEMLFSLDEIRDLSGNQIKARHALFLFDSCFSGLVHNDRGSASKENLDFKKRHPVRQYISAGTGNETVPDRSEFRRVFIEVLEGKIELGEAGIFTASQLGVYMRDEVPQRTNYKHHPQFAWGPRFNQGDFVFEKPEEEPVNPEWPETHGKIINKTKKRHLESVSTEIRVTLDQIEDHPDYRIEATLNGKYHQLSRIEGTHDYRVLIPSKKLARGTHQYYLTLYEKKCRPVGRIGPFSLRVLGKGFAK